MKLYQLLLEIALTNYVLGVTYIFQLQTWILRIVQLVL